VTSARPASRQIWRWQAVIVLCAIVATLPLAIKGDTCGQDFDFHIQSWLAVAQDWHRGVPYPHWIEAANYGAGEPRLVFYPPFSWALGALLGIILPWAAAPIAFTLIVLAASGLSMYKLASEWLSPNAAAAAACAYILNPYAFFVADERTAYGELAAGIWLPLIVLYTLRCARNTNKSVILSERQSASRMDLRFPPDSTKPGAPSLQLGTWVSRSYIPQLALSIAAIWLTNAPAAVMASYTIAVIALWKAIQRRKAKTILPIATSFLLGIGLSAFYLIPAAYERRWVDIARALDPGMRIIDSFLFDHTGQSYHDQVLRTASWIFILILAAIIISVAVAWKRSVPRRFLLALFGASAILLLLQLPSSTPIWNHAPELQFLQFPWRWTLVLSLVLAISLGLSIRIPAGNQLQKSFALQITFTLLAALAVAATATYLFWQPCDEEDIVSAQLKVFHSGSGFEGTDEYTSLGVDNSLIQQGLPLLRILKQPNAETADNPAQPNPDYIADPQDELPATIKVQNWQPERKSVTISTQSPGYAVLRLMDYPAWRVHVNGAEIAVRPHRQDGLMTIPIQAATTQIEIAYTATRDVFWGQSVSAISLVTLLTLAARRKGPKVS
jgi:hypothetical protein